MIDLNDMATWFPPIQRAGLPVPRTHLIQTDATLLDLLDGVRPDGHAKLMGDLHRAAADIGYPCFLRTGHLSGKHGWRDTCRVMSAGELDSHVVALVEASALADMFGSLPTVTWAVREMLPTTPLFRCQGYGGFPVTREFRLFYDSERGHEHWQPYWPADAVEAGRPDNPNWRAILESSWHTLPSTRAFLRDLAAKAVNAVGGGYWSVDFLATEDGWKLIDMAEGDRSFRWDPPVTGIAGGVGA